MPPMPEPAKLATAQQKVEGGHRQRRFRGSHQGQSAVQLEQVEVGVDVVIG